MATTTYVAFRMRAEFSSEVSTQTDEAQSIGIYYFHSLVDGKSLEQMTRRKVVRGAFRVENTLLGSPCVLLGFLVLSSLGGILTSLYYFIPLEGFGLGFHFYGIEPSNFCEKRFAHEGTRGKKGLIVFVDGEADFVQQLF